MILIADGGSTKTEWRLIDKEKSIPLKSAGINPFFNTSQQMMDELTGLEIPVNKDSIQEVVFYGAGLTAGKVQDEMEAAFRLVFKDSRISLNDDLTAAARALFTTGEGIACILGTGSNSGLFRNGKMVDKIPALGYILGDEGSGAHIGTGFLNALLKRKLPLDFSVQLIEKEGLEMNEVLNKVYRERLPNRYLASLTKIVKENIAIEEIRQIVLNAFSKFIEKNISSYENYRDKNIGFVGSVAWHFQDELKEVLDNYSLTLKKIIKQPIDELVLYHRNFLQ